MGLLFSLHNNSQHRNSEEYSIGLHNERAKLTQTTQEDGFCAGVFYLLEHWEDLLRPWQRMMCLYFSLLLLTGCGGLIFNIFEYDAEQKRLDTMLNFLDNFNQTYFTNDTHKEIITGYAEVYGELDTNKWSVKYASFFACTTFTTIGFGFQSPITNTGRIFAILYSIPAIWIYCSVAKRIGDIALEFFSSFVKPCLSEDVYYNHKNKIIGLIFIILSVGIVTFIKITATEEGFGTGITTWGNALYFLWVCTSTIGFGDVMMSGSNIPLTLLMGVWLSTTMGMFLTMMIKLNNSVVDVQTLRKSIAVNKAKNAFKGLNKNSMTSSNTIQEVVEKEKKTIELNQNVITENDV